MLPVKSWRIIYEDGSEFTSKDGSWAEAPPFGVQCVVYYDVDADRLTVDGGEDDGHIYTYEGEQGVKMGLWMDTEGYYRLYDLARRSAAPEV